MIRVFRAASKNLMAKQAPLIRNFQTIKTIAPLKSMHQTSKFNSQAKLRSKKEAKEPFPNLLEEEPIVEGEETTGPKKSNAFLTFSIGLGVLSTYLYLGYGDDYLENESTLAAINRRAKESVVESYEYFMYPPKKALLPPLPRHMHKDYTLCLELTDALTHCVWDLDVGWRVAIRPGAKEFLYGLHQFYEVVLFTDTPSHLAEPVVQTIDQVGFFLYKLFREHHRLDKDTYLKDLEYLNRDLSKVLVVETDMRRLATHPENGMKLEPWMGTKGDHELEKLGKTLQEIALWANGSKVKDLRLLLNEVKSFDENNITHGWELYKNNLKLKDMKPEVPQQQTSFYGSIAKETTNVLSSLVGGGIVKKETTFGPANNVDQLEKTSKLIRENLSREYKKFLVQEKLIKVERLEAMEKHKALLAESDLSLMDYMMGNVPGIEGQAQK